MVPLRCVTDSSSNENAEEWIHDCLCLDSLSRAVSGGESDRVAVVAYIDHKLTLAVVCLHCPVKSSSNLTNVSQP